MHILWYWQVNKYQSLHIIAVVTNVASVLNGSRASRCSKAQHDKQGDDFTDYNVTKPLLFGSTGGSSDFGKNIANNSCEWSAGCYSLELVLWQRMWRMIDWGLLRCGLQKSMLLGETWSGCHRSHGYSLKYRSFLVWPQLLTFKTRPQWKWSETATLELHPVGTSGLSSTLSSLSSLDTHPASNSQFDIHPADQ